ncbi:MAG: class I SAM-dependent methyltransferase [Dehalococcoidales bacterium]|nr:class I SAM-dependent methyltransferase [Dehalococcoidales bacterium]
MATINLQDIKKINHLWHQVYPYLVAHIMEHYRCGSGTVLELGPFSGGISRELARSYPDMAITIAAEQPEVVAYLEQEVEDAGLGHNIKVKQTDLDHLDLADSRFDLIAFRGAFFFLEDRLLQEIFRVLAPGGLAFVGGGYGKNAPPQLIDNIHDESQVLNKRLGRKWVTREELEAMLTRTGLAENCQIEEVGGIWLIIRK